MKRLFTALAAGFLAVAAAVAAHAQTAVYQSGVVTPGNPVVWTSNRFIGDATLNGGFSALTITATTPTLCVNDALTTTAYHQLCLGAINSAGTAGAVNYGAFGGAASLPLNLSVNGGAASLNVSALTLGAASSQGSLVIAGSTSGTGTIKTAAVAGTVTLILPITNGTAGQPLLSGAGSAASTWGTLTGTTSQFVTYTGAAAANGDCATFDASGNLKTSGASCASSGVGAGTAGNLPYYATSSSAVSANTNLNISNAALTIGVAGVSQGSLSLTGAGSGTVTIAVQSGAGTYNLNLPITAGVLGQVLTSGGGGGTAMTWTTAGIACCTYKNSAFAATALTGYCVDTTGGSITATLPASPANGDAILFMDCGNTFVTNNLVLARNGNLIMNSAANLTDNTTNGNFIIQWDTHFSNWVIR